MPGRSHDLGCMMQLFALISDQKCWFQSPSQVHYTEHVHDRGWTIFPEGEQARSTIYCEAVVSIAEINQLKERKERKKHTHTHPKALSR